MKIQRTQMISNSSRHEFLSGTDHNGYHMEQPKAPPAPKRNPEIGSPPAGPILSLVEGGLQMEITLFKSFGDSAMSNILTVNIEPCLKIPFYEKQKVRTTILFLPAAVATRSQAAVPRRGQTPESNLRLSLLEPEPSKENFQLLRASRWFASSQFFLNPMACGVSKWRAYERMDVLGERDWIWGKEKKEFPRQELVHPIPFLQGEESPLFQL